jgi:hypothetical protein
MAGLDLSPGGISDRGRIKDAQARAAGATELDIQLSRQSGVDARDVMNLRRFTQANSLLIILRCPKPSARAFHGDLPAKTWATKQKTNATGTVYGHGGVLMVSDYDMMSMWRATGTGYQKIFVSSIASPGAASGPWLEEARRIVREMNGFLVTKIQHGCQDDFQSVTNNPGVKMSDHFLAIRQGDGIYLRDPIYCENFYRAHALFWPYGAGGKYIG